MKDKAKDNFARRIAITMEILDAQNTKPDIKGLIKRQFWYLFDDLKKHDLIETIDPEESLKE